MPFKISTYLSDKKFHSFMEAESSLPCSQKPIIGPSRKPLNAAHPLIPSLLKIHFNPPICA
jgi:hypothetical protein